MDITLVNCVNGGILYGYYLSKLCQWWDIVWILNCVYGGILLYGCPKGDTKAAFN